MLGCLLVCSLFSLFCFFTNRYLSLRTSYRSKAQARGANAELGAATASKRVRAANNAAKKPPVEALLALASGLDTFDVDLDVDFDCSALPNDPLIMADKDLRSLNLLEIPLVIFLADREGSQQLVNQLLLPLGWVLFFQSVF